MYKYTHFIEHEYDFNKLNAGKTEDPADDIYQSATTHMIRHNVLLLSAVLKYGKSSCGHEESVAEVVTEQEVFLSLQVLNRFKGPQMQVQNQSL